MTFVTPQSSLGSTDEFSTNIEETFADRSATLLTSRVRIPTNQELENLQPTSYSAAVSAMPEETVLLVASLAPLDVAGAGRPPRILC